jgi:hypothetical protein
MSVGPSHSQYNSSSGASGFAAFIPFSFLDNNLVKLTRIARCEVNLTKLSIFYKVCDR